MVQTIKKEIMDIEHLINNTYQLVDDDDIILFQGSYDECFEMGIDKINDDMDRLQLFLENL